MRKKCLASLLSLSLLTALCVGTTFAEETSPTEDSTVNNGEWDETFYRVIGLQTIAQAEQAAKNLWYQTFSRESPSVSEHELDLMRFQLLARDGALYKSEGRGLGGGGRNPVLDQMISRTATEAVFAAHMDWGDDEYNDSFEFSVVLEDGEWRYLNH